jgi:hypothetical protein
MKKTILNATLIIGSLALSQQTNAQGLLGKLKDKVGQAGTSGFGGGEMDWNGFPIPSEKEGAKDLENTKIDAISYTKDKWNISGLYVSQKAIGFPDDRNKGIARTIQKFAVQASADGKKITFTHNEVNSVLEPGVYYSNMDGDSKTPVDPKMKEKGLFFSFTGSVGKYAVYTDSIEYNGKPAKNGVVVGGQKLTLLEPGVFVMHPMVGPKNGVTTCAGGSRFNIWEEVDQLKYNPFNLIYKKGQNISKWTNEAIIKELFRQSDLRCSLDIGARAENSEMPQKVNGFKDEPANVLLLKAAQKYAASHNWKETIVSVYPIAEWQNNYKLIGLNQLNTLYERFLNVNVVMKTPAGECAIETISITQDNIFTTGSITENFAGKPLYGSSNGDLTPIDCSKTK